VVRFGGSRFAAASTVSTFHRAVRRGAEKIGVVATPCQALALAKLHLHPDEGLRSAGRKIGLVIGLFCGWAFSWRYLRDVLAKELDIKDIRFLDVPPSSHQVLKITTDNGEKELPLDRLQDCVRSSCRYCFDMTAEFADISVGAARLPEGWEASRGWNQLIVRTETGRRLVDSARDNERLELREPPPGGLDKLKRAAAKRKRDAIARLTEISGRAHDWVYLSSDDPWLNACLQTDTEEI
jgi:coenzyme F420 hydrogenase subunit beta